MKIGLISDIHADLTGLRRALAILRREGVDEMLCLGDLIDKGPEGDLVVMMLEALELPCIQGNHDHDAPIHQAWRIKRAAEGIAFAAERLLTPMSLAYLKALPFELRYVWDNVRVLAVHGSPADIMEYLYASSPPAKLSSLAQNAQADVILCGHTHQPMHIKIDRVHFINPGSVAADYTDGSGTCATLTLPEMELRLFRVATGQRVRL